MRCTQYRARVIFSSRGCRCATSRDGSFWVWTIGGPNTGKLWLSAGSRRGAQAKTDPPYFSVRTSSHTERSRGMNTVEV